MASPDGRWIYVTGETSNTVSVIDGRRYKVIETIQPLLSKHFNLTVEMPLKAIVRGHACSAASPSASRLPPPSTAADFSRQSRLAGR